MFNIRELNPIDQRIRNARFSNQHLDVTPANSSHTTASSPSALPYTTHGYTSHESRSYRHAQAGFQSMPY